MSLVERLEKLAKELDQQRWRNGKYDADKADQSDLVAEAAKKLRRFEPYRIYTAPELSEDDYAKFYKFGFVNHVNP